MDPLDKGMTFAEADKIVRVYGRYIEYCSGIIFSLFEFKAPESCLPFPKNVLEEALTVAEKHYHCAGDTHRVNLLQDVHSQLGFYIDDEKALLEAAKKINDAEFRKKFLLPVLKNNQKEGGSIMIEGLDK